MNGIIDGGVDSNSRLVYPAIRKITDALLNYEKNENFSTGRLSGPSALAPPVMWDVIL
jgi:hypothetical protein